ncbi:MAG: PLP-dependent lyase/thiolase [Desulfobacterales bacterium]
MTPFRLACPACARTYRIEDGHFSCPRRDSGGEHLLRRVGLAGEAAAEALLTGWERRSEGSFARLGALLSARQLAGEAGYRVIHDRLHDPLERLEGAGFRPTPLREQPALAAALGRSGPLWVKDETGNAAGSHKGRHLFGTLLYLEALACRKGARGKPELAIYSCGNAALAAAAVARAGGYRLHAFVPSEVDPRVEAQLEERGAQVERIARSRTGAGDPCYLAFREALERHGFLPFACAGNDNWSNIEGGSTLGWEIVLALREHAAEVGHIVLQVGGAAFARAVAQALEEALALGLLARLPKIHACQPEGGFPFVRAWVLTLAEIASRSRAPLGLVYDRRLPPARALGGLAAFLRAEAGGMNAPIEAAARGFEGPAVQQVLRAIARAPRRVFWPWDGEPPRSLAHGILDDLPYDGFELLRALLRSGGRAVILAEERIRSAWEAARRATGIPVCPTGAAGLAGLMELEAQGLVDPGEAALVVFTGRDPGVEDPQKGTRTP